MRRSRSNYVLSPISRAREQAQELARERPGWTIGGLVLAGAVVAFGIWIWPEVHRTIRIHRM